MDWLQLNQVHILSSNTNEVRCQCSGFDSMEDAYSHCGAMRVILADENSSSSLGSSIMGSTPVYSFSLEDCSSPMQLDKKLWNNCNSLVKSFANSIKDPLAHLFEIEVEFLKRRKRKKEGEEEEEKEEKEGKRRF